MTLAKINKWVFIRVPANDRNLTQTSCKQRIYSNSKYKKVHQYIYHNVSLLSTSFISLSLLSKVSFQNSILLFCNLLFISISSGSLLADHASYPQRSYFQFLHMKIQNSYSFAKKKRRKRLWVNQNSEQKLKAGISHITSKSHIL